MDKNIFEQATEFIDKVIGNTVDFRKREDGRIDVVHIPEGKNQRKTMCHIIGDNKDAE